MKKQTLAIYISLIPLFGLDSLAESSAQAPQVQANQEIVEKIYRNAVNQSEMDAKTPTGDLKVVTGGDLFQPATMKLTNNYYDVSYADYWSAIPQFGAQMEDSVFESGEIAIHWTSGFSYSYLERIIKVISKKSILNSERTTNLKAHFLPISTGFTIEYKYGRGFSPFLSSKVGAQWVYQSGTLDGLEQGFWVPFYHIGLGVTLFEPSRDTNQSVFGGVRIAVCNQKSISSAQTIEGLSTNLGIVLKL